MEFTELISLRRSYRKLDPIEITDELIQKLMKTVQLAPSCENKQPWRFVFVTDPKELSKIKETFDQQNDWAKNASLYVGVFSKPDLDCRIQGRDYYLFDTGIAVSYLMLRATELGLTAHPISFYDEEEAKKEMNIPQDMKLITIIVIGKHVDTAAVELSSEQAQSEIERPRRLSIQYLSYLNKYVDEYEENKERFSSILSEN